MCDRKADGNWLPCAYVWRDLLRGMVLVITLGFGVLNLIASPTQLTVLNY